MSPLRAVLVQCQAGVVLVLLGTLLGGIEYGIPGLIAFGLVVFPNGLMAVLLVLLSQLGVPAEVRASLFWVCEGMKVLMSLLLLIGVGWRWGATIDWLVLLIVYTVLLLYPLIHTLLFYRAPPSKS